MEKKERQNGLTPRRRRNLLSRGLINNPGLEKRVERSTSTAKMMIEKRKRGEKNREPRTEEGGNDVKINRSAKRGRRGLRQGGINEGKKNGTN